jgi:hypothetical protein
MRNIALYPLPHQHRTTATRICKAWRFRSDLQLSMRVRGVRARTVALLESSVRLTPLVVSVHSAFSVLSGSALHPRSLLPVPHRFPQQLPRLSASAHIAAVMMNHHSLRTQTRCAGGDLTSITTITHVFTSLNPKASTLGLRASFLSWRDKGGAGHRRRRRRCRGRHGSMRRHRGLQRWALT